MPASNHAYKTARRLRRNMSLPEVLLWQILRRQPGHIKFRRQHPIGRYVLDFYVLELRLAIEIDGLAHHMGTGQRGTKNETTVSNLKEYKCCGSPRKMSSPTQPL